MAMQLNWKGKATNQPNQQFIHWFCIDFAASKIKNAINVELKVNDIKPQMEHNAKENITVLSYIGWPVLN